MSNAYAYPGDELALFEKAVNWKRYLSKFIKPLLQGRVLEAGAGIGGTTLLLNDNSASEWVLLEPDHTMQQTLEKKIEDGAFPTNVRLHKGDVGSLSKTELFDAILYIDVLEHIEDDAREMQKAVDHLLPGGHLVILSPAFQFLYSPFDKAIGHYRRYNRSMLRKIAPAVLAEEKIIYLDSIGFFASAANKTLLKQRYPTSKQVLTWDRWMIPVSKITDRLFFHSFGKSILFTAKKK